MDMLTIEAAFLRHERIAFQFSGGRDSTAALYLLRAFWDRMTVYHLDTGESYPEGRRVLLEVERDIPITRVYGDVQTVRDVYGLASDIIPVDNWQVGLNVSGRETKIIGRYECCARSLMEPMHRRMLEDGITLIVRGQRDEEFARPVLRSGAADDKVELLFPIQDWTSERVMAYIAEHGLPLANFYAEGMPHGSDCMGCTAWWSEGRAAYLRKHYPAAADRLQQRLRTIRIEVDRQYETMNKEMSHG